MMYAIANDIAELGRRIQASGFSIAVSAVRPPFARFYSGHGPKNPR